MNERLKKIADLIDSEAFSLDVGCDHAFLDIYLVNEKKHKKVAASDNKEGPLKIAKENIKKAGCEGKIEVILGDGLEAFHEGMDTVVISGMGGLTILGILRRKKELLKNIKTLILSPNNYQANIRREVSKMGYKIVDEYLIQEKNIIYTVIKFERGKEHLSKQDIILGPILRKKREKIFIEQLEREKMGREVLLKLLPKSLWQKRWKTKQELKWIIEEQKKVSGKES